MTKKLFILMSVFVFLSFININVYATNPTEKTKEITVKLNEKILEFDTEPIIVNDRTMVPMRAIFENLGAQVEWYDKQKTVTGYRRYKNNVSDMFIKLKIGDTTAYRNGNSFHLDSPPIIRNDRTLVPVRFIAESFGIDVKWDAETRTVLLISDDDVKKPELIDDISYIPKYFDSGINLMIPEFWNTSDSSNKFGYKDEEDNIQMIVDIKEFKEPMTLDEFTEKSKAAILETYKDRVVFTGSDKLSINNIDINVIYLKNSSITPEINQVLYYFTSSKYSYSITFSYYSQSNDSQLLNIISNIIHTIEIDGVINTENEHYIEYKDFFNYGINLNTKISSSMEVQSQFDFKGTLSEETDLEYFIVEVSKGDEKCKFKIPISNNKFDSKIYTPFGLGNHNVTIIAPKPQENSKIMQFNIINSNSQDIRYLIPSLLVEKNDNEIINLAKEITKDINKYLPKYDESKAIFKWIYENIEYDELLNSHPRSAKKVLTDKKGTNEEISYLYAALLRASNIPSKIVKGKIDNDNFHVWNEIKINGRWIIADATWGSGYTNDNNNDITGITKKLDMNYFNPNRKDYENKFIEITTLKY
ncbi:stalk domain-containing protein [Paramaledivibacter caminithermalis]|uniref:Copper amine oxidase N-terminal domain-containing protein n=1 Tax=Paramaledivibacter caminithermalis (strain DSM 15212 / CIP 107654 / DViRD3) TaxID=1121301 RepID=A0A1M6L1I9_PARC5|nr:stalk domain-containing protein [Paramaledivibacter caminithermalis]SHJ65101.1 Copper amine oxidase N-terminal domain-containing protein [Paramaledivibacter caminithermalis DSM 15212]